MLVTGNATGRLIGGYDRNFCLLLQSPYLPLSLDEGYILFLEDHAVLSLAQTIPSGGSRLSEFVKEPALKKRLEEAEEAIYGKGGTSLSDWGDKELETAFTEAGYSLNLSVKDITEARLVTPANLHDHRQVHPVSERRGKDEAP